MKSTENLSPCKGQKEFVSQTLAFWQSRTLLVLTDEDASEIMETLYALYLILYQWHIEDYAVLLQASSDGGNADENV